MSDALTKSERETLKSIYRLSRDGEEAHTGALAEALGVSPGTATATVKRLARLDRPRRRRLPRHARPAAGCARRGAREAHVRRPARAPGRGSRPHGRPEGRATGVRPQRAEGTAADGTVTDAHAREKGAVRMTKLVAAEGGYQAFKLGGTEWFWLVFSAATAVLAVLVGFALMRGVLAADQGTPKMREIALAIQEGAMAYLKRQFRTIGIILIPLAVLVFLTSTSVLRGDGTEALSFAQSGIFRTLAFLAGCLMSGLTGFIGMGLAVRGNVRTAAAAKVGSLPAAHADE